MSLPVWLEGAPGQWRLRIAAQPGAKRTQVNGEFDDCLRLRIAAPPVDGRANTEIIRFLAEHLKVPRRSIRLLSGASSRRKRFAVEAPLEAAALQRALDPGSQDPSSASGRQGRRP